MSTEPQKAHNHLREAGTPAPGPFRPQSPRRIDFRKGVYVLPNLITSASLFCGFYSLIQTLGGHYENAAWAILASAVFDAFDGTVARMTNTASDFGVEYDSLSDAVAFGVAPGVLMYAWALQPFGKWGWAASSSGMRVGTRPPSGMMGGSWALWPISIRNPRCI